MRALRVLTVLLATLPAVAAAQSDLETMRAQARPGAPQARLGQLAGAWTVTTGADDAPGAATARMTVGGRFLEIDFAGEAMRWIVGFDARHHRYQAFMADTNGTYFVTGAGPEQNGEIAMLGIDDDPIMSRMGLTKKFVFGMRIHSADRFDLFIDFVDTRTPAERRMRFAEYRFVRKS